MDIEKVSVEVRDKNLIRYGTITAERLSLSAKQVFNGIGEWTITLGSDDPAVNVLKQAGSGIIIQYDGAVFLSGPMTSWEFVESAEDSGGTIQFSGVSDDVHLWDRVCYPDPYNPNIKKQSYIYDKRSGPAEDVMFEYANANLGPKALPDRRLFGFSTTPSNHAGGNIEFKTRFEPLGEVLRQIATVQGLGFAMRQKFGNIELDIFTPRDRSKHARLSVENNTLSSGKSRLESPTVTNAIVAGQGKHTSRLITDYSTPDSRNEVSNWNRRIETFVDDRQSDKPEDLKAAGDEVIAEGGRTSLFVTASPVDGNDHEFMKHFHLGDKVSVIVNGTEYADIISAAVWKIDGEGFNAAYAVGLSNERDVYEKIDSRINNLERVVETIDSTYTEIPANPSLKGKWIRIARYPGSVNGSAKTDSSFTITSSTSGFHDVLRFNATSVYQDTSINLQDYVAYRNVPSYTSLRFTRDPNGDVYQEGYLEIFTSEDVEPSDTRVEIHTVPGPYMDRWEPTSPKVSTVPDTWTVEQVGVFPTRLQTAKLLNGWTHSDAEAYEPVSFIMGSNSIVSLQGAALGHNATYGDIFRLPKGARPGLHLQSAVAGTNGNTYRINIEPDGHVRMVGNLPGATTPLTGITFQARK